MKYFNKTRTIEQKVTDREVLTNLDRQTQLLNAILQELKKNSMNQKTQLKSVSNSLGLVTYQKTCNIIISWELLGSLRFPSEIIDKNSD